MAEIIDKTFTRPQIRVSMAKRHVQQAIEMLTDDTVPYIANRIAIEPLRIVAQLLAELEREMQ